MDYETTIKIVLTSDQLAEVFIGWGNDEQAEFFNLIGQHFKEADFNAELQCCYISDDINKAGKDFIYTLANFIKVHKLPPNSPKINMLINSYDGDSLNLI